MFDLGNLDLAIKTRRAGGAGGVSPAFQTDFSSLPSWVSYSRASADATMFDSTGKLTYAPNNLLLQSGDLTDSSWIKSAFSISSGVADPDGGTNAFTLTATGASASLVQSPTPNGPNAISSIWVRLRSGSITSASLNDPKNTVNVPITITSTWTLFSTHSDTAGIATLNLGLSNSSGAAIDVYHPQVEIVTYETSPRAYNPTTSSPYYGPRFDYAWNGSAWVATRLMDEEQRTNLVFPSASVGGSGWNAAAITFTANATTSPDGTNTAYLIKEDGTTADHVFFFLVTVTSGATYTWSVFAKAKERSWLALSAYDGTNHWSYFNLGSGTVGSSDAGNTASIQSVGNGWYRCILTRSVSSVSATITVGPTTGDGVHSYAGDGTSGIYAWGADIEPGSFATSYIPTTSAAVTRSADIVQLTGAALTALQASAASIIVENDTYPNDPSFQYIVGFSAGDGSGLVYNGSAFTEWNGSANLTGNSSTRGTIDRVGLAFSGAGRSIVSNGGTVASDGGVIAGAAFPTIYLGSNGGASILNGHIRSLAIYTSRLSDATLQAKSVVGAAF